jgi:hypothetical protein
LKAAMDGTKPEKMADNLGGKMAKTIVYNFAYISVNKIWKIFSLWILRLGVLIS